MTVCRNQLAELCAPVAQIVDAVAFVTGKLVELAQRMPDDRCAQMPDVKGLGNVRRRIVEHDLFAAAEGLRAVPLPLFEDFRHNRLPEIVVRNADVQVAARNLNRADAIVGQVLFQRRRNLHRRAPQFTAEPEAGKRKIAHRGVWRVFQHAGNLLRGQHRGGIDLLHPQQNLFRDSFFDGLHINTSVKSLTILLYYFFPPFARGISVFLQVPPRNGAISLSERSVQPFWRRQRSGARHGRAATVRRACRS